MTTTRRRPTSAIANDERIRESAIAHLADRGVTGFTLSAIARAADLSHTAMTQRFADTDDLLCDVWTSSVGNELSAVMEWAAAHVDGHEDSDLTGVTLKRLLQQTKESCAFTELLIASMTIPKLGDVVAQTFRNHLAQITADDQLRAAQLTFLVATIVGILCEQRATRITGNFVVEIVTNITECVARSSKIVDLPQVDATHLKRYDFDTGDARRDRILESCLACVGRHGFEGTTTKMIARDAGVSEGLIFSLFPSKVDVFFEATMIQTRLGIRKNLDFVTKLIDKYGRGVANAILIREWCAPHLRGQRVALLEQTRMTWHDAQLRRRIEKSKQSLMASEDIPMPNHTTDAEGKAVHFVQMAIPTGLYVLVEAFPPAAGLPFSAVTTEVFG